MGVIISKTHCEPPCCACSQILYSAGHVGRHGAVDFFSKLDAAEGIAQLCAHIVGKIVGVDRIARPIDTRLHAEMNGIRTIWSMLHRLPPHRCHFVNQCNVDAADTCFSKALPFRPRAPLVFTTVWDKFAEKSIAAWAAFSAWLPITFAYFGGRTPGFPGQCFPARNAKLKSAPATKPGASRMGGPRRR
jgi:hypothetical protein